MKKFLLAITCMLGFTSCEMDHHEHKAPLPPKSPNETPVVPDRIDNSDLNR